LPEWLRGADSVAFEGRIVATLPERVVAAVTARRITMAQFAELLQRIMTQPVWDRTGLTGKYYFAFRAAIDASAESDAPAIPTVLRDLDLDLKKAKGMVEYVVVDSFNTKPTDN
jgi:uncharacterized protein (TIGR03435 family)